MIPNQPIFIEVAHGDREYTADIVEGEARRVAAMDSAKKAVAARHPSTFAPPAAPPAVEAEPECGRTWPAALGESPAPVVVAGLTAMWSRFARRWIGVRRSS